MNKRRLIHFYFGAIEADARLSVERDLLSDPEFLLDYFDLKRQIEAAEAVPEFSAEGVLIRLRNRIRPPRRLVLASLVGALAASFLLVWYFGMLKPVLQTGVDGPKKTLFDARGELSASSGVF